MKNTYEEVIVFRATILTDICLVSNHLLSVIFKPRGGDFESHLDVFESIEYLSKLGQDLESKERLLIGCQVISSFVVVLQRTPFDGSLHVNTFPQLLEAELQINSFNDSLRIMVTFGKNELK